MKIRIAWLLVATLGYGCSSGSDVNNSGGTTNTGGAVGATGGTVAGKGTSGGTHPAIGGTSASGGSSYGTGGTSAAVSGTSYGGTTAVGGGNTGLGGIATSGGVAATSVTGGTSASSGGTRAVGGVNSTGGTLTNVTTGGTTAVQTATTNGGTSTLGGAGNGAGGVIAAGGATETAGADAGSADAGTQDASPNNSACAALLESLVGWWSFDGTLAAHGDAGGSLVPIPDSATPSFVAGIGSGQALDLTSGPAAGANDNAFNVTGALTLSAFIKSAAPDGRIIDRITAGGTDGYLLDVHAQALRMIVGSRLLSSSVSLTSLTTFTHVAGVFTGGANPVMRLYVDGDFVTEQSTGTGSIPSNSLPLRIGVNQAGGNVFSGQIDEPMVIARALDDQEIKALRQALLNGACP